MAADLHAVARARHHGSKGFSASARWTLVVLHPCSSTSIRGRQGEVSTHRAPTTAGMLGMSERAIMRMVYWPRRCRVDVSFRCKPNVGFAVVGCGGRRSILGSAAGLGYLIPQAAKGVLEGPPACSAGRVQSCPGLLEFPDRYWADMVEKKKKRAAGLVAGAGAEARGYLFFFLFGSLSAGHIASERSNPSSQRKNWIASSLCCLAPNGRAERFTKVAFSPRGPDHALFLPAKNLKGGEETN